MYLSYTGFSGAFLEVCNSREFQGCCVHADRLPVAAACWSGCALGYYYAAEHRQPVRTHCPMQVSGVLSWKCVTVVPICGQVACGPVVNEQHN